MLDGLNHKCRFGLLLVFMVAISGAILWAGPETGGEPQAEISLWSTIASGRLVGVVIMIVSLVAAALIIENFISIRRDKLVPEELVTELAGHMDAEDYEQAVQVSDDDESFLGAVIAAGLRHRDSAFGFFEMQNAMQEVSERQVSRMYRKLEYLSFIGAVAPILGLLGTVTGMIRAFNQIALTEGMAKPSQLAGGISEALVTTCMGLIVAIPTMFFATYFRNRIDSFIAEAETIVDKLVGKFRKTSS